MKPYCFLDVDGVLNTVTPNAETGHTMNCRGFNICIPKTFQANVERLMEKFDMVWLTTWEHSANEEFGKFFGWDEWPVPQLNQNRVAEDGARGAGSLYAMGLNYSLTGIFYNKQLAEQIGMTAPPQTVAEFEDPLAKAKAGTNPDTGEAPTPAELTALQAAADEAAAAARDAATKLTRAQAAVPTVTQEQDALVATAEAAVPLAEAQRRERLAPVDTAGLSTAVSDAQKRLTDAKAALSDAEAKAGAEIPVAELVFLPSLPQEVQNVAVEVGDTPNGAVMTISGSQTLVESGLSGADRRLVEVGTEAVLEDEGLGLEVPAVVTFVADKPGGAGLSADRYGLRLEPAAPLPEDALNLNLRVSIPISSSGGEVLAVPLAALSAGANGTARVEVERSAGQVELVEVVTGLRADGYVEVRSAAGAPTLAAGDRVVVGRDLELPGQAAEGDGTTNGTTRDTTSVSSSDPGS